MAGPEEIIPGHVHAEDFEELSEDREFDEEDAYCVYNEANTGPLSLSNCVG